MIILGDFKIDEVTQETLKEEKAFQKLKKKHNKDLNNLMKRQLKEKAAVQKLQCNQIDKYMKSNKQ